MGGITMKKRMMALGCALALSVSLFSGCGQKEAPAAEETASSTETASVETVSETGIDTSEEVEMTMYLLGDKAADFDAVYEKINEKLKEKVNATLNVKFLSWAEHDTKYSLLFSSGEDFDLIFTASGWGHYEATATKNGFYEITEDFVKTYAPDVFDVVPADAWEQAKIDGKAYMVPNYQKEYGVDVIGVRGDLMEKYGITDIASKEDLEKYFEQIMANEEGTTPMATQGGGLLYPYLLQSRGYSVVRGVPSVLFAYEYANPENLEISNVVDSPEFMEYAKKMREMYTKGYWSADSLSTTDTRNDNWTQGKSAAMVWNLGSVVNYAREINKANPDWKATFIDIAPGMSKSVNPYTNNGVAINAASKNPERAMMVINELMTNPEVYDLASLGIEGTHWEAADNNQYKSLDGAANFPANGSCNWGWTNMDIKRELFADPSDQVLAKQVETLEKWNAGSTTSHIYDTFSFNDANVKSEIAVVNTLVTQYLDPINIGMVEDVDGAVKEFSEELKKAGIEKIYAEVQKQADEFVKSKQ